MKVTKQKLRNFIHESIRQLNEIELVLQDTPDFNKNMGLHKKVLYGVISRDGESKKLTDILPLDGGSIGIAHFAAKGLNSLYDAMGDKLAQKYFDRTVEQLKKDTAKPSKNDCRGSTPRGENDNGTGCYKMGWWRKGMEKFVADGNASIQYNAWKNLVVIPGNKMMDQWDQTKWGTYRARAIGYGIQNSTGDAGLLKYSANGKNDPEKTLKNYVGGNSHRKRRKAAIDKHFPLKKKVSETKMKVTRRQLFRLIQESINDAVIFPVQDDDGFDIDSQPLPMAGARQTFSQDTGLFGSNLDKPDDMRDMSVPNAQSPRQADKMLEARYALVYFKSFIEVLDMSLNGIYYNFQPDIKDFKDSPGADKVIAHVSSQLGNLRGIMNTIVQQHGDPSMIRWGNVPNAKEIKEADKYGAEAAEDVINSEGFAQAYSLIEDMAHQGNIHHLMTVEQALETLGTPTLYTMASSHFEGFSEVLDNNQYLEMFDLIDRLDRSTQLLRK